MLDHATSLAAGETAVLGNNISIPPRRNAGAVRGKESGDRHPKIGNGDDWWNASIPGNIRIGENVPKSAHQAAWWWLPTYPSSITVVGVPAKTGRPLFQNSVCRYGSEAFQLSTTRILVDWANSLH